MITGTLADQRFGCNIIVRPPERVVSVIQRIQDDLRRFEPEQYYYPSPSLHLTLVEILHGADRERADRVAESVRQVLGSLLVDVLAPRAGSPHLAFDRDGCALQFVPDDDTLQRTREQIMTRLSACGVEITSRYPPQSAHVTFMRYVKPLYTDREQWIAALQRVRVSQGIGWSLDEVHLNWGLTWYGMRDSIHEAGPWKLERPGVMHPDESKYSERR